MIIDNKFFKFDNATVWYHFVVFKLLFWIDNHLFISASGNFHSEDFTRFFFLTFVDRWMASLSNFLEDLIFFVKFIICFYSWVSFTYRQFRGGSTSCVVFGEFLGLLLNYDRSWPKGEFFCKREEHFALEFFYDGKSFFSNVWKFDFLWNHAHDQRVFGFEFY